MGPVSRGNMASLSNWKRPGRERLLQEGGRACQARRLGSQGGTAPWDAFQVRKGGVEVGGLGRVFILSEEEEKLLLCFKPEHDANRFVFSKLSLVTVWRADWSGARLASRDL